MKRFFFLFDRQHVHSTFVKFADKATGRVCLTEFRHALQDLEIQTQAESDEQLFRDADIIQDGGLDLDAFERVISRPSELEQWCSTLPLAKLLGFCLEAPLAYAQGSGAAEPSAPLRRLCNLSGPDIGRVADEFHKGLRRLLVEQTTKLKECFTELDRKAEEGSDGAGAKFQTISMSAGRVDDFHKGLTDRVGELAP